MQMWSMQGCRLPTNARYKDKTWYIRTELQFCFYAGEHMKLMTSSQRKVYVK